MTDLTKLPEVSFCDTDTTAIEQSVITAYEGVSGLTLYPGDPVRLFLEGLALVIAQQRQVIEYSARQNLVAHAQGAYLDQLGALHGTTRLTAQAATTTLRFTLSAAQTFAVSIAAGTRATPDRELMFTTTTAAEVAAGETFVDVDATCEELGATGNGYVAGQVNQMVDLPAYVASVENTTLSAGGANEENDDRFRLRIAETPESYSVAGPLGAYLFWARTAHQDVADVSVRSPSPGEVEVRPLLGSGVIPPQEILDAVEEVLSDKKVRPLTDNVTVLAPEVVTYDLNVTYWIDRTDLAVAGQIQTAVSQAIADFIAWQRTVLGRDINPSELIRAMVAAGAKRVDVTAPAYAVVESYQVGQEGIVTTNYGGLEDG